MGRRRVQALLLLAALCCAVSGGASAISGQSYETFYAYYRENVDFINTNDSRHLLPLSLAGGGASPDDRRPTYELVGDILSVSILIDPTGQVIETCDIRLTAPPGMEYGNAVYNDFAISGYHSYALLMAMHTNADPARRYELVEDVVAGMAAGGGAYTRQLGVYTLSCTRSESTALLSFQNNQALSPEGGEPPGDDLGEDEGAGLL